MAQKVSADDVKTMLEDVAAQIERGGLKSVTIKAMTANGEFEHTFPAETEEERTAALLAIRTVLGQVH